jgi:DNA helicase MCM9
MASDISQHLSLKTRAHVRCSRCMILLHNHRKAKSKTLFLRLGQVPECQFIRVPRSSEVNRLICFMGTVTRTGQIKMLETKKLYDCSTCSRRFPVLYDPRQYNAIPKPYQCLAASNSEDPCDGKKFKEVVMNTGDLPDSCKDYQEIKVQEQVTKLAIGTIPRGIVIILEDDLVDCCKPGNQ